MRDPTEQPRCAHNTMPTQTPTQSHSHTHESPSEARERQEKQNLIHETDARRRTTLQDPKLRPADTFEALERHVEEVKKDEEARTKAFEESSRFKRIEKANKARDEARGGEREALTEEEAIKRARETLPPGITKEGDVEDLPYGAALPPAVPEPRFPNAGAWERPLAEPPPEDVEEQPANARKSA